MKPDQAKLKQLIGERTLVVIKPDGVLRKLIGEILTRFERKGLKIVAMKMLWPSRDLVEKHYTDSEDWLKSNGERTYNSYIEKGITPTLTPRELALETRKKLMNYMGAGPVVAMVLEGPHVVEIVRKMRGHTSPLKADVGTVGFDYTLESYEVADAGGWAIKNIIHASDADTAESEIKLWFQNEEIMDYSSPLDEIFYDMGWMKPRA
jgi:nucleoside-diphosphate kinase